eukprot:359047-Chlamydomonas_euryale.AAC.4
MSFGAGALGAPSEALMDAWLRAGLVVAVAAILAGKIAASVKALSMAEGRGRRSRAAGAPCTLASLHADAIISAMATARASCPQPGPFPQPPPLLPMSPAPQNQHVTMHVTMQAGKGGVRRAGRREQGKRVDFRSSVWCWAKRTCSGAAGPAPRCHAAPPSVILRAKNAIAPFAHTLRCPAVDAPEISGAHPRPGGSTVRS